MIEPMTRGAVQERLSLDEVKAVVTDVIPGAHIVAMLDTLESAQRGDAWHGARPLSGH